MRSKLFRLCYSALTGLKEQLEIFSENRQRPASGVLLAVNNDRRHCGVYQILGDGATCCQHHTVSCCHLQKHQPTIHFTGFTTHWNTTLFFLFSRLSLSKHLFPGSQMATGYNVLPLGPIRGVNRQHLTRLIQQILPCDVGVEFEC